ncbi:DMT family transporter [Stappia taiwanensis]|uniref:DMT family transporter n=1 Tax=Stappia taiwanensis TaxID=992267 RepID=A0A838XSU3_9HYPH|nr:DMT family transporter [Stappia taiwanensis]MBA4611728.1 DMT family transporter [Stappia taiwanensis]GGE97265.1 membrane protein [Stappia taiwanensis]
MLTSHQNFRAYAMLVTGGVCLGMSPVVVKALPISADLSAFYRVAFSAPLFMLWALWDRPNAARCAEAGEGEPAAPAAAKRMLYMLYGLAALLFAADLVAMHVAIRLTNASIATLFTNCAPFFVGVYGILGLTDRPKRAFWQALPVALVGATLLVGVSALTSGGDLWGDAIALLAGAFYAAYLVTVRQLKLAGASSVSIMVIVTAGSALCLLPLVFLGGGFVSASLPTWGLIAVLVLIGQVAGQGLVTGALKHLPVTSSSIVLLIQPVVAAPLSWIFLSETLSLLQITGMGLVLFSIAVVVRPQRREVAAEAAS